MSAPQADVEGEAGEGLALLVITTGLPAMVSPLTAQVTWLAAALIVSVASAVAQRRRPRPPTSTSE